VYGWNAIPARTRQIFHYNWKYRAFWDGISRRKKVELSDLTTESARQDPSSRLLDLGFNTCGVLEKSDKFLLARKRPRDTQVFAILTEIGALIALLKKWHLSWIKSSPPRPRHKIVSARHFSSFRGVSKEFHGVFPTASDFSHAAHERDYRILNICLLNLNQAIMDVQAAFPDTSGPEMQAQLRSAEYDAATCASELCSVVPWSAQPGNSTFACVHAMQPLQYAARYFYQHGKLLQLEWCQRVTESLTGKYGIDVKLWEDSKAFASR